MEIDDDGLVAARPGGRRGEGGATRSALGTDCIIVCIIPHGRGTHPRRIEPVPGPHFMLSRKMRTFAGRGGPLHAAAPAPPQTCRVSCRPSPGAVGRGDEGQVNARLKTKKPDRSALESVTGLEMRLGNLVFSNGAAEGEIDVAEADITVVGRPVGFPVDRVWVPLEEPAVQVSDPRPRPALTPAPGSPAPLRPEPRYPGLASHSRPHRQNRPCPVCGLTPRLGGPERACRFRR